MDSQSKLELVNMLTYILIPIMLVIFALIGYLVYAYSKNKNKKQIEKQTTKGTGTTSTATNNMQNKQSIFKFMEFDEVIDNMIIQKNHSRFLMAIECQGINYDLMSGIEKTSVEEGFVQFLNSLRYKIQIYIQTRSIDLESSLEGYRERVREVETKLNRMQMQYQQMLESEEYSEEQLAKAYFELTKQTNLYEYGRSVLQDTERMSLNKNILNKKYYIIIPYFSTEAGSENLDKEELRGIAFSELYTRAQSIIRSISVCGVRGKVLTSNELVELLYMAYNRDEAEVFGLDKALKAGYNEMYSTAPDVLKKKMKELDKAIEEKALQKAQEKVEEARTEIEKEIDEKEENMDDIIAEMAELIIKQNEKYIGKDVKDKAIEKLNAENTKEGGKKNEKKKSTRSRNKNATV